MYFFQIHLAVGKGHDLDRISVLTSKFPESLFLKNNKGKSPIELLTAHRRVDEALREENCLLKKQLEEANIIEQEQQDQIEMLEITSQTNITIQNDEIEIIQGLNETDTGKVTQLEGLLVEKSEKITKLECEVFSLKSEEEQEEEHRDDEKINESEKIQSEYNTLMQDYLQQQTQHELELKNVSNRLEEMEQLCASLKSKCDSDENCKEIAKLTSRLKAESEKYEVLKNKISKEQGDASLVESYLKNDLAHAEAKLSEVESDLREKVASIESERENWQDAKMKYEKDSEELKIRLSLLQDENAILDQKLKRSLEERQDHTTTKLSMSEDYEVLTLMYEQQKKSYLSQIGVLKDKVQTLTNERDSLDITTKEQKDELDNVRDSVIAHDEIVADHVRHIDEQLKLIRLLTTHNASLRNELIHYQNSVEGNATTQEKAISALLKKGEEYKQSLSEMINGIHDLNSLLFPGSSTEDKDVQQFSTKVKSAIFTLKVLRAKSHDLSKSSKMIPNVQIELERLVRENCDLIGTNNVLKETLSEKEMLVSRLALSPNGGSVVQENERLTKTVASLEKELTDTKLLMSTLVERINVLQQQCQELDESEKFKRDFLELTNKIQNMHLADIILGSKKE